MSVKARILAILFSVTFPDVTLAGKQRIKRKLNNQDQKSRSCDDTLIHIDF